jgi:hypothetical protein
MVAQGNPHVPIIVADPPLSVMPSCFPLENLFLAVDYDLIVVSIFMGVNRKLVSAVNKPPHSNLFSTNTGSYVAPVLEKKTK